jgi:4-hydroxymandelate oxidase
VAALASGSRAPVIVKGVTTPAEAKAAIERNVKGVIVSSYGRGAPSSDNTLVLQLSAIVDAVGGRVPVLVDGGFRRGTDILKALAFGAQAVLVGRPVMWGLAAYGADGVRGVIEMLQTELARFMAMSGRSRVEMLGRDVLRVHAVPEPSPKASS